MLLAASHIRRRCGAGALLSLLLAGLVLPAHAESLSARLHALTHRRTAVQQDIRQIRRSQQSATYRLQAAEADLNTLQERLDTARGQLRSTRQDLTAAQANLTRLQKQLDQDTRAVQGQLLALYQAGNHSYLQVVLQADSFSDFANRGHYVDIIVNQDQYRLRRLATLQSQCDAERQSLVAAEARRTALVGQIAQDESAAQQRQDQVHRILAEANSKRAAAESLLAAMDVEQRQIQQFIQSRDRGNGPHYGGVWSGYLLKPVDGRLSSPFGWRMDPNLHYRKFHQGVDLAIAYGTPIHAAAPGLVVWAGWRGAVSGNTVIIDHGSGVTTVYCHCSSVATSEGQEVKRGQVIAAVGSTGRSTGPHVHFGVLQHGAWVDPLGFTR
ncbi:MAG TPA: peptidoglycan DD-metalloendopeptidase family protein [Armatimonadota bacterium]|jgi:murein DD-endopeptidase MepM/ murein hydrolase activator NlpD